MTARTVITVEHQGRALTMRELARVTGTPLYALRDRYRRGIRGEELVRPVRRNPRPALDGRGVGAPEVDFRAIKPMECDR